MAKAKRFPAPANVNPKDKAAPKAAPTPTVIEGKSQETVEVHYTKENHHILTGVHALRKGKNTIPKKVWDSVKDHPTTKSLVKDGHIVPPAPCPVEEEAETGDTSMEDDEVTGDESDESDDSSKEESK